MQPTAIKRTAIVVGALSALVVFTVSGPWAQSRDVPAMPMSPPMMMPPHGMPPFPPMEKASPVEACLDMSARGVAMVAYFKARLNLTTEQLGAWQDLEAASTEIAKEERGACALLPTKVEPLGAMQVLSITEERLSAMQRHLQKIGPPSRKVYDVLSADQRKVVDSMMMMPPPPMLP